MYTPVQHREERPDTLPAAIRDIQLATLVTAGPGGIVASHLPMVLKGEPGAFALEGHLARANPHWRELEAGPLVGLAVFQGPQAYVSPGWYASKREHGKVVPTWNYIAVHARGPLEIVADPAWLAAHLDDLTRANEAGREKPWAVTDAPGEFIANLSRAIVGLRLQVETLDGAWKMIQHRPEGDRLGAMENLAASPELGPRAVAAIMRELEAARGPG